MARRKQSTISTTVTDAPHLIYQQKWRQAAVRLIRCPQVAPKAKVESVPNVLLRCCLSQGSDSQCIDRTL